MILSSKITPPMLVATSGRATPSLSRPLSGGTCSTDLHVVLSSTLGLVAGMPRHGFTAQEPWWLLWMHPVRT